ncbi:MAG TPA: hypothetical protein G4O18_01760 [Dehalococcoidia bacterium]|nr:hypothetical protein [Dehalococcoidia bacterium]
MAEEQPEKGTEQNPLTREDVLKAIEENGGTAEGLDLSGMWFENKINLGGLELKGIILQEAILWNANLEKANLHAVNLQKAKLGGVNLQRAKLNYANLKEANLSYTNLQEASLDNAHLEKANLTYSNLERAKLFGAYLENADLSFSNLSSALLGAAQLKGAALADTNLERTLLYAANLEGVFLQYVKLSSDTFLQNVEWGTHILAQEKHGQFRWAVDSYRQLKTWYTEHGMYDIAGKFFYREMEAKRKDLSWRMNPLLKLWSWTLRLLCGYGEGPERVIIWAASVIFGLAAAYYFWGTFDTKSFGDTLYYSVASFTALGYGQWAPQPTGWAQGMGAVEAVIGVFSMALFLVTFTRKMTR